MFDLKKILERHKHWLKEDCNGWENMRANLQRAELRGVDLRGADLQGADLQGANLQRANLQRADLRGADLQMANLQGANLTNTKLSFPLACPDTGSFIGWKKADGKIVKLEIPSDAKRLSAVGRKCRCNKVKVIAIEEIDGAASDLKEVKSNHDSHFVYKVGETKIIDDFDDNRWNECSTGIHFFITRQEAVDYNF